MGDVDDADFKSQEINAMKLLKDEVVCTTCKGDGLVSGDMVYFWEAELCQTCNGHGVVLVINGKVLRYERSRKRTISSKPQSKGRSTYGNTTIAC